MWMQTTQITHRQRCQTPTEDLPEGAGATNIPAMSTVAEIIDAVKKLNDEAKGEFLEKLADVDFDDEWDRQIEADAKAGRLDFLWEEARKEIAEGRTRPLDDILNDE